MPVPIGNFISRKVYANRLKTEHAITANTCCRFVDVSHGKEVFRGGSWVVSTPNSAAVVREVLTTYLAE